MITKEYVFGFESVVWIVRTRASTTQEKRCSEGKPANVDKDSRYKKLAWYNKEQFYTIVDHFCFQSYCINFTALNITTPV